MGFLDFVDRVDELAVQLLRDGCAGRQVHVFCMVYAYSQSLKSYLVPLLHVTGLRSQVMNPVQYRRVKVSLKPTYVSPPV